MDPISKELLAPAERTPTGQWKPGRSGNPATQFGPGNKAGAGRKRSPVDELCGEVMEETREAIKQQMKQTLTSRGMAGVLLLREIFDRVGGKVTQGIELSGGVANMTAEEVDARLQKLLGLPAPNDCIDTTATDCNEPERDNLPAKQ